MAYNKLYLKMFKFMSETLENHPILPENNFQDSFKHPVQNDSCFAFAMARSTPERSFPPAVA